jgi:hypothetical protein
MVNNIGSPRSGSYFYGWLYCWPLMIKVWQRSGSYCCGCLNCWPLLLIFDRGVVDIVVAAESLMVNNITSHKNMNHSSIKYQTEMVNNITATTIWTTSLSNLKQ